MPTVGPMPDAKTFVLANSHGYFCGHKTFMGQMIDSMSEWERSGKLEIYETSEEIKEKYGIDYVCWLNGIGPMTLDIAQYLILHSDEIPGFKLTHKTVYARETWLGWPSRSHRGLRQKLEIFRHAG